MSCSYTDGFVSAVNAQGLCGARDWRLPSRFDLQSIVSNDRLSPAVDPDWFPDTQASWFWSSSPNAGDSGSAWSVHFDYGEVNGYGKGYAAYVRLVRG